MASTSTSHDRDVEAQRDVLQPQRASYNLPRYYSSGLTVLGKVLGEGEIRETANSPSEVARDASQAPVGSESQAMGAASISPALAPQCDIPY
jgi:hypothetical protein